MKYTQSIASLHKHLRESGGPINTAIVIAVAKGIIMNDTSMPCVNAMSYLTKD